MARSEAAQAAPVPVSEPTPDTTAPLAPPAGFAQHIGPFEYKPEDFAEFGPVEGDRGDMIDAGQPVEPPPTVEPESTPEPVVTPDPVATTPEPEPEPEPESTAPRIPKARFDEVNEERKRLRAENERLQMELASRTQQPDQPMAPATSTFDFESKEKEYMEAVLDGDTDKALGVRNEIRNAEFELIAATVQQAVPDTAQAANAVQMQLANQAALETVNAEFPVFNPDAEGFDADLTEEAVVIAKGFMQFRGMAFPDAIRKAAEHVAKLNDIVAVGKAAPAPAKPTVDPKAVQSKIQRAQDQPPTTPVQTVPDEPVVDPLNLNEDEFEKLPAAAKARLRGDYM